MIGVILVILLSSLTTQAFGISRYWQRLPETAGLESLLSTIIIDGAIVWPFAAVRVLYGSKISSSKSLVSIFLMIILPFIYALFPDCVPVAIFYYVIQFVGGAVPGLIGFIATKCLSEGVAAVIIAVISITWGILIGTFLRKSARFSR